MAKKSSIEITLNKQTKDELIEAAEAHGMELSTFLVAAAQAYVDRARRLSQPIYLSKEDSEKFLSALQGSPRDIPEGFRNAKARHSKVIKNSE